MVTTNVTRVLVIGGAGYIGSHVVKALTKEKYKVAVYDNLLSGKKENIVAHVPLYKASILNRTRLKKVFAEFKPHAIIHLAAEKSVGKSMENAAIFSDINITGTINILNIMHEYKTPYIVFSSSAAIFGVPQYLPIDENHLKYPINYYGETKLIAEKILLWYDKVYSIKYATLRYFNAAGHTPDTDITVIEKNPKNLIPIILETALGKRKILQIFGNNYNTPDGTCIRDYIHVSDLAAAHVKSIQFLQNKNTSVELNLGTGKGFSVKETYNMACKVTGKDIAMEFTKPLEGDPAELYANSIQAQKL